MPLTTPPPCHATGTGGSEGPLKNYVGPKARGTFFDEYRQISQAVNVADPRDHAPSSPRQVLLNRLVKTGSMPIPLCIRDNQTHLKVAGRGWGDAKMLTLAECLHGIPGVHGLDLADNRMTHRSLLPLIGQLASRELTYLNLSQNGVDSRTADALGEYIGTKGCRCESLNGPPVTAHTNGRGAG